MHGFICVHMVSVGPRCRASCDQYDVLTSLFWHDLRDLQMHEGTGCKCLLDVCYTFLWSEDDKQCHAAGSAEVGCTHAPTT